MSKPSVIYLCPNGYLGGAERFVLDAALGHKHFGHYGAKIIFFGTGQATELAKSLGIDHYILKNKFRLSRPWDFFKAVKEIRALLKAEKPQMINATMPYAHYVGSFASFGLDLKKTWYQHGPVGGWLDTLASLFKVDQVFFNSSFTLETHNKSLLFHKPRLEDLIIPYGIMEKKPRLEEVEKIKAQFGQNETIKVLLAGRICPWKGYETVFEAISNLFNRNPNWVEKIKIIVVGDVGRQEDKPYKDFLEAIVKTKNLENNVTFLGAKSNLHEYFAAVDCFIHCSKIPEPFGLVVAEAMIQNCLVVGSNQGGTSDVLIDTKTGFSFDPVRYDAVRQLELLLIRLIPQLLDQAQELQVIRNAGKQFVLNHFNVPGMIKKLEAAYQNC